MATAALVVSSVTLAAHSPAVAPSRGLSHADALAAAYDAILNADFDTVPARLAGACTEVPAFCEVVATVSLWWQIALDPSDRRHDAAFTTSAEGAIASTDAWATKEPARAEAWFARGAAYGVRAQWRVLRNERLAAARDGKQIKESLERALQLDPGMHDAEFGIGMYRYYADITPAALRFVRWLLLLPGGDRVGGLQQMQNARARGEVLSGEAAYQLHLVYLWYEHRATDALALIRDLQARYPRNPLFSLIEADIHDRYFHDPKSSEAILRTLIDRAQQQRVNAAAVARRRADAALIALRTRAAR